MDTGTSTSVLVAQSLTSTVSNLQQGFIMVIAYFIATLIVGIVFLNILTVPNDIKGTLFKTGIIAWVIWSGVMLVGQIAPYIQSGAIRVI